MALIKCTECNNDVSDKSSQCIHCGNPMVPDTEKGKVIIRFKLPKNRLILATSVNIINAETGNIITKLKPDSVTELKIDKETTIYAAHGFTKSKERIILKPDQLNKVLVTYSVSLLSTRLTINFVDTFLD